MDFNTITLIVIAICFLPTVILVAVHILTLAVMLVLVVRDILLELTRGTL